MLLHKNSIVYVFLFFFASFLLSSCSKQDNVCELYFLVDTSEYTSSFQNYRTLADEFNQKHPNIHINIDTKNPALSYDETLENLFFTRNGPDIFLINSNYIKPFYNAGFFYDMKNLQIFDKLTTAAKTQASIGDIGYCMPTSMTAYVMLVNLDTLKKFKLNTPTNLNDFIVCCDKIKSGGLTPISWNRAQAFTVPALANGLYNIYASQNAPDIVAKLNNDILHISSYMKNSFALASKAITNGWYGENPSMENINSNQLNQNDFRDFADGKTAFMFTTLHSIKMLDDMNKNLNYIATGVPVSSGLVTLPMPMNRICINSKSSHIEEASSFIEYMCENMPHYNDLSSFQTKITNLNRKLSNAYLVYSKDVQIPVEDLTLKFSYWESTRNLIVDMFSDVSVQEACGIYDAIQRAAVCSDN